MDLRSDKTQQTRGILLLPNLLTTAALFAGFYAIVQSFSARFDHAAIAIFIASLLDGLDGRVARLVNAQSKFGKEYDSLSDVISFGVAPALVVYTWALRGLGGLGEAVAFIYLICIAIRLARYNSRDSEETHMLFSGLASPAAAVVISSMTWFGASMLPVLSVSTIGQLLVCMFTVFISVLTVLNIPYRSFKELDFRSRVPFLYIFSLAFIFISIAIEPAIMLLFYSGLYALSGPFSWARENRLIFLLARQLMAGPRNKKRKVRRSVSGTSTKTKTKKDQLTTATIASKTPANANGVGKKRDQQIGPH